ncbi:MAG: DNA mismatch repair endonuclease MutL [Candidatus Hodarchaeota archaeon]
MGQIIKIDDYEKIAAGEVIERPASIVKELLENAIDAGASRIEIHVENAGKKAIKVIDNGSGIEPDDVKIAFERHTTSKIRDFSDIYNLSTLGFRGEALASVKAVAKVEMITKTSTYDLGRKIVFKGNALVEETDESCPDGTTITVKDLFYNVPVRKKFLKNDAVEFAHVSDIVTRYALVNHDIDIKLYHNGRKILDAPPSNGNLLNTIVSIYGKDHARHMLPLTKKTRDLSVEGFIATPSITRSSRLYSSLFVNKRYVYSINVAKAIENAYHGKLMKNRFPFFVLFLDIDPQAIDVNIHPTKKEIKFFNEESLLKRLTRWVQLTLEENKGKSGEKNVETSLESHVPSITEEGDEPDTRENEVPPGEEEPIQHDERVEEWDDVIARASDTIPRNVLKESGGVPSPKQGLKEAFLPIPDATPKRKVSGWKPLDVGLKEEPQLDRGKFAALPKMRFLNQSCQLGNTFLFFESNDGDLVIVDQHAASERVEYEKLKEKFKTTGIKVQELLIPKKLNLPPSLIGLLEANEVTLKEYGFEFVKESDGDMDVFKVVKFPYVFHRKIDFQVIEDFLEDLLSDPEKPLEKSQDEILQVMACHSSIRSGEPLSSRRVWELLLELDKCKDPYHCCHGRPTWIVKTFSSLEKDFKRIV